VSSIPASGCRTDFKCFDGKDPVDSRFPKLKLLLCSWQMLTRSV